jgi:hypothetical protein
MKGECKVIHLLPMLLSALVRETTKMPSMEDSVLRAVYEQIFISIPSLHYSYP